MISFEEKISKISIFFIGYTLIFYMFFSTLKYTLPFVLAIIFAYILKYPAKFLINKFKFKDWLACAIVTIIFFGIILLANFFLVSSLVSELIGITKYLQQLISNNSADIYNYFLNLQNNISTLVADPTITDVIRSNLANSATHIINGSISVATSIIQGLLTVISYIPYIGMVVIFTLLSTYFFTKKLSITDSKKILNSFPPKVINAYIHGKKMLLNYILSYIFLIFISFVITLIGFTIFNIKYSLVLSLICALLDLLPILGVPMIYIPIALSFIFEGNYFSALGIGILYACVFFTRQIMEPKIMSSSLGLSPVAVLGAIFIGLQINGFSGMIFCMFLIVFYNVLKKVNII